MKKSVCPNRMDIPNSKTGALEPQTKPSPTRNLLKLALVFTVYVSLFLSTQFALAAAPAELARLDHLDFLSVPVTPPEQAGHTTYRLAEEPELLALWTYAEPTDGDAYRYVGGGDYDAEADTWSQGAFNADDLTRAAVVYLRHWQATGQESSRASAYGLLRTVTYLQTVTPGPSEGNVVLWMQPDGTLNPSAEPVELPDPSDSGASYWLARTVWALGEGYAAFAEDDPAFAAFLGKRMDLALGALERQVLVNYPVTETFHGFQNPTWLINDGGDATSEAVYGLAAYTRATGDARAEGALRRFAEGLLLLTSDTRTAFPFGATLPWTGSRSLWHGWGAQMAGALATAGDVLGEPDMIAAARHEMVAFMPLLLTQGGADQGWTPVPAETVQIAYGADAALQNLLAVADATGEAVFGQLAGVAGAWYFGNNRATTPMYESATGRTFDGLETDGSINPNSGAESTIHGLLSMLALDAHPAVKAAAYGAVREAQEGWTLLEAEAGDLLGGEIVTLESAWNGEANVSGGAYLRLSPGGSVQVGAELPATGRYAVLPVFEQRPVNLYASGLEVMLGAQRHRLWLGGAGDPGVSVNEGLQTVALADPSGNVPPTAAGTTQLTASPTGGVPAHLDAFLLRPEVARLELGGDNPQALFQSFAPTRRVVIFDSWLITSDYDEAGNVTGTSGVLPTSTPVAVGIYELEPVSQITAYVYDETGRLTETVVLTDRQRRVPVEAGGFSYVTVR